VSNLIYTLRRRMPRCVGDWAMQFAPARRFLKALLVRQSLRLTMSLEVAPMHPVVVDADHQRRR